MLNFDFTACAALTGNFNKQVTLTEIKCFRKQKRSIILFYALEGMYSVKKLILLTKKKKVEIFAMCIKCLKSQMIFL